MPIPDLQGADTHHCYQEYVDGQLKNKYGDAFIRGNNGETQLMLQKPVCSITLGLSKLPLLAIQHKREGLATFL